MHIVGKIPGPSHAKARVSLIDKVVDIQKVVVPIILTFTSPLAACVFPEWTVAKVFKQRNIRHHEEHVRRSQAPVAVEVEFAEETWPADVGSVEFFHDQECHEKPTDGKESVHRDSGVDDHLECPSAIRLFFIAIEIYRSSLFSETKQTVLKTFSIF